MTTAMKLPTRYSAARKALSEAVRVDEVKAFRDKAHAMRIYAFQAKDGQLAEDATDIKMRATRRLGELMAEDRAAGRMNKGGRPSKKTGVLKTPVLKDQNIDKGLAKAARKAAAEPEAKYEARITKTKRIAKAVAEGDQAVIKAARAEQQAEKKKRRTAREHELASKIIALPDKRYGVVLADPEWNDEVWSKTTGMDRHASNHYPTSDAEIIAARDVKSIAAKDCVLFLWTTNQHLRIAIGVMEAWGFEYKSNYCWGKNHISTGRWNRSKHELLLIGTHGHVPCPAPGNQWDSLIMAPKSKHSEKPEKFYQMIEEYFPNLPKIELNARKTRKGWDCWGAEAPIKQAAE